jgi:exonuclease III
VVVGDFNIPLSPLDRLSRPKKIKKDIIELNDSIDQMGLRDIARIFYPATAQYTFFSAAHGTFFKIDHILGCKARLGNIRKLK